jgi:hypothetical protein
MFHIGAFAQDVDLAAADTDIDALQDTSLFTSGDTIRVPVEYPYLWWASAGIGSGGTSLARLESPTLRETSRIQFSEINGLADADVEPTSPTPILNFINNPVKLTGDEQLKFTANSNTSAAAFQWCVVAFGGSKMSPISSGNIIQAHFEWNNTATARQWTAGEVTFQDTLPYGTYQLIGMRVVSTTGVAARIIPIGVAQSSRPGIMMVDTLSEVGTGDTFRNGNAGLFSTFNSTTPVQLEVLCDAADASSTTGVFDLIKIA